MEGVYRSTPGSCQAKIHTGHLDYVTLVPTCLNCDGWRLGVVVVGVVVVMVVVIAGVVALLQAHEGDKAAMGK